ncbi:MAG: rRNA maturation RNase YbeY [Bacteroidia bacterium]|nr:rRNA maturation RNase YbeY [Bacteroidia bacterium]
MPVSFHQQGINSTLIHGEKRKISAWISQIISSEKKTLGNISIIFTGKNELLKMNNSFLSHNFHTDIITFNYNEGSTISGDLFIGVEQVIENANELKTTPRLELLRVIVHGVFHLLGYNDSTDKEKSQMRKREDKAIALFNS